VPTHAQRMTFLLRADTFTAFCRSRKGGVYIMGGEVRAGRGERGYEAAATACTGPDSRLWGPKGHARSARKPRPKPVTLSLTLSLHDPNPNPNPYPNPYPDPNPKPDPDPNPMKERMQGLGSGLACRLSLQGLAWP
jgi:hypothetical protein